MGRCYNAQDDVKQSRQQQVTMVSHSDHEQSALHLPEWLGETHWLTTKKKFQGKKMSTEAQMWNYLSLSSTYISSGLSTVPIPTLQKKNFST